MTQANAQDLIGRVVGGLYRVDKKLGEGGMGAVYKALDVKLERTVALKVIRPELGSSPDFAARFLREAKAAARFKHPNSVDVYMTGEDQGLLYMALEFIEGRELRDVIRERGALPADRAVAITTQILSALQKAHEQGIVHRDLKPQNVMVTTEEGEDAVKILDFGIAKMKDTGANGVKTQAGTIMGTVAYMSPEQARGEEVDGRSDLYAVGIMLYQMVTGDVPFQAKSSMELLKKQIEQLPPPPRSKRADIPEALEKVILKALEKKREDRYPDARAFSQALAATRGAIEPTVVGLQATGAIEGERPTQAPGYVADTKTPPGADPKAGTKIAYEQGGTAQIYAGLVGRTIDDKYEVLAKLGEGGMGAVFKARHKLLDKFVALKVVHPALGDRPDVRERFLREAKAAMEFVHPNAVPVRDFGQTRDGLLFMTQDFSPGQSLRKILETEKRIEAPRALALARQMLLALGEAHHAGIVHRDVKPENVLVEKDEVTGDEIVRVCDFGIAKLADAKAVGKDGESLTGAQVIGTPHYMAPEQASGEKVDGRSDLYALGCLLYELLSGRKVFEADSVMQVLMKQVTVSPEPLSKRVQGLPAGVEALVMKLLVKEPLGRFQTAEETVEAIDALGITLPGRILGRTRGGRKTTTTKPTLEKDVASGSSRALARAVFALALVFAIGWAALALVYSADVDAKVPGPLRPIARLLARYTPPPPGPSPEEIAKAEAEKARLEEEKRKADEAEKARLAAEEKVKAQEAEAARLAEAKRKEDEADAARLAEETRKADEAEKARLAAEAKARALEEQLALAEKQRAEDEARRRQADDAESERLAAAKREAEAAAAALAQQKKEAEAAAAALAQQKKEAEEAAARLAQQQKETQDEERKLALAREEARKRREARDAAQREAAQRAAAEEAARQKAAADEAARQKAAAEAAQRAAAEEAARQRQQAARSPSPAPAPSAAPVPDASPPPRPQPSAPPVIPQHPITLPAPAERQLSYGKRTFVPVGEGNGFFWMQDRSVTVKEYLAFCEAIRVGRVKGVPFAQWRAFAPDAGTKLGKTLREEVDIDGGRSAKPLARITDPPASLADLPVEGITLAHAKAFAAWVGGGARLPSASEAALASQTKALADLGTVDGIWGDSGLAPTRRPARAAPAADQAVEGIHLRLVFSR